MIRLTSPHAAVMACLTLCGAPDGANAQEREPPTPEEVQAAEAAPLFDSHETLELTLEADFHTIRREDRTDEDSEERPAVLRWSGPDGTAAAQDIQIQTRGNFRLARRNCEFPPLRLNVKTGPSKGTVFEGQDKLKLVVPCKLGQDYWEQYVLSEYLVYRTYNLFSPLSFRVRLVRVTYVDSSGEDDTFTRYGFLIEDDDVMATRNGGWKLDWTPPTQLNPVLVQRDQAILVDIFQYFIGNTDWSGAEMHNMELFQTPAGVYATIPYDFDFSGIIDARYANPDASLAIRSVRQRLFRGFCPEQVNRQPQDYERVYETFRQKKDEVYALWSSQEGFDPDRLKDTLEYMDEFYETLDNPRLIQSRMLDQCRRIG